MKKGLLIVSLAGMLALMGCGGEKKGESGSSSGQKTQNSQNNPGNTQNDPGDSQSDLILSTQIGACGEDLTISGTKKSKVPFMLLKADGATELDGASDDENSEVLRWSYDAASGVLTLLHDNHCDNCAYKFTFELTGKDGSYKLSESGSPNYDPEKEMVDCIPMGCLYDLKLSAKVPSGKIKLDFSPFWSGEIDLSQASGAITLTREGECNAY